MTHEHTDESGSVSASRAVSPVDGQLHVWVAKLQDSCNIVWTTSRSG